jgi:hypothetical protein
MQHAIKSVTRYWPVGFRMAMPWMLLLALWQIITSFISLPAEANARLLFDIATIAIVLLAVSSIAVSWHRFVLLDEAPDSRQFRIDQRVLRYFFRIVICTLAGTGLATIPLLLTSLFTSSNGMLIAPAAIVAYIFTIIFSLSLPPVALDLPSISLTNTLRLVRGNEIAMLGFAVLNFTAVIAGLAASLALAAPLTLLPEQLLAILLPIVTLPISLFTTLISISAVTAAYGFFVEEREFK